MDKKILIIHHKSDNDGILSAALITNYLLGGNHNKVHLWGVDYDDLNNLWKEGIDAMTNKFDGYFAVFITDMSFNDTNAMIWMKENIDNFYWFDHHKPIIDESKGKFDDILGIRNTQQSAILCVYQFIYNPELKHVPTVLQTLSDYDCWQWVNKDYEESYIMAFNTGYTFISKLDVNFWLGHLEYILEGKDKSLNKEALEKGQIIEQYNSEKYEKILKNSDKSWLVNNEKTVVVFTSDSTWSNLFKSLRDTDVKHAVSFKRLESGEWKVGLYNINDSDTFDCGLYLKENYNGDGHKGAAGCIISEEQMLEIIKNKSM